MADFNMYNKVPHNVVVPEFGPEREAPIFPQITRRYYCQEDVAGLKNHWDRLTWQIQQPDRSMVWSSVKLVMPMDIQCFGQENVALDMRVSNGSPSCNVALSETPMNCFRQTTMSLNGKVFMEDNVFRRTLNTCYRGVGPQAYGDNHSLKPIVNRNLRDNNRYAFPVRDVDGANIGSVILERPVPLSTAFSLLEHNSPFIERARLWQDNLDNAGTTWRGLITSYLELGPFQARARKSNTAVPYINDFLLRLQFDSNPSRFDAEIRPKAEQDGSVPLALQGRVIPCKLLEFGTLPNMLHHGESIMRREQWPVRWDCTFKQKPYLEITYVKFPKMQPYYNLRCFEHQYQNGNDFKLLPDEMEPFNSPPVLQRVTSDLLSYPTKVYLWCDHSRAFKDSYISGGVRRSCTLSDIHCRINQRPEVISAPSQEACFEMFQRHTNSSLEFGSWKKSPIYCFDPVDLGQSDMLSNDARRIVMEWDVGVAMTPLQVQEHYDSVEGDNLRWEGYDIPGVAQHHSQNFPVRLPVSCSFDGTSIKEYDEDASEFQLIFRANEASANDRNDTGNRFTNWNLYNGGTRFLQGKEFQISPITEAGRDGDEHNPSFAEHFVCRRVNSSNFTIDGCLWARLHRVPNQSGKDWGKNTWDVVGDLFYVPKSQPFQAAQDMNIHTTYLPFSSLEANDGPHDSGGQPIRQYKVKASAYDTIPNPVFHYADGANAGRLFNYQGPDEGIEEATPGPIAWMTDYKGIRNDTASPEDKRGMMKAGEKVYLGIDQTMVPGDNDEFLCDIWVPIIPTTSMIQAGNMDNKHIVWLGNESAFVAGNHVERWQGNRTGQTVHVAMNVERVSQPNEPEPDEAQVVAIDATDGGFLEGRPTDFVQGLDVLYFDSSATDTVAKSLPEYSLKVLYEYGNAQYQFTQDGMPTRVLPNLIPVRESPLIPNL